jgi:hypothetical protein
MSSQFIISDLNLALNHLGLRIFIAQTYIRRKFLKYSHLYWRLNIIYCDIINCGIIVDK